MAAATKCLPKATSHAELHPALHADLCIVFNPFVPMDTPDTLNIFLHRFLAQVGAPQVSLLEVLPNRPRSAVRRLQLTKPWHGHEWIIAKQVVGLEETARFDRELASLRLLSSLNITPTVTPQLLAWDAASHILLYEDLGDRGLGTTLLGQNQAEAHAALLAYVSALGRMHASTASIQQHDGCFNTPGNPRNIQRDSLSFRGLCEAAGVAVDIAFDADVNQIETVLNSPGPFRTLTHGDPCPDNDRLSDSRIMFIDFETGGFDHALLDAAYFTMAFPTCWCVGALPLNVLAEMHTTYRHALAAGVPEAADDLIFSRHLLHACARWLLDGGTLVQRLLHRLQAFTRLAEGADILLGLTATTKRLYHQLASRWSYSEQPLAGYPAFVKP